ncbi:MAG: tRNA epoxyqueuosine(34) reductase QueG [Bacteroidetes bacterium]|nr:tRNA epoxyqueuosine(34) reductase QueG [Bacteroidota bacterium]MCL1967949.1 tRNA epoxyqueuosine(34) reductase QueG [Bacteroidota bacterium]
MIIEFQSIKHLAKKCGFALCGIAKAVPLTLEKERFENALFHNYHARKNYLEHDVEKRFNPVLLLENCKSVIVCGFNYNMRCAVCGERYKIARYAQMKDYHLFMKEKLELLAHSLKEKYGDFNYKTTTDSSAISEKAWAVRSGIGYYGKNGIIQTKFGSFVFIGILLIDKEIDVYDKPNENSCGTCNACMNACPAQAIVAPYCVNSNLCISNINLNKKETDFTRIAKYGWLVGCDVCQNVCPNNAHTPINEEAMHADFAENKDEILETLTPKSFEHYFKDTPLYSLKYEGLKKRVEDFVREYCNIKKNVFLRP